MNRRGSLQQLGALALFASPLVSGAAAMFNTKKPIKEFGKVYDYLKDHELRTQERGGGIIEVDDADFSGEEFINVTWKNFIFRRCNFPASYEIKLTEAIGCRFMMCDFGPGRKDVVLSFGDMKNGQFYGCKFTNGNVSFGWGEALFQECEFLNTIPLKSTSWNYFLAGDNLNLVRCKFQNFGLLCDETKLHMKNCDYQSSTPARLEVTKEYTADFILEYSLLQNAEKILWNAKIKSLTLRGIQVKGKFSTQKSVIRDTITLEGLKVGTYYMGQTGTEKKITIRDCYFSEVNEKTTRLFNCSGDYAVEFLMERVECTNAAACDLTGSGEGTIEEGFHLETTRNQTFTLRGCKIPHLLVNGLQTYNLVIENCEFGTLELKDGRIGNVTIKNTKFETLDFSRTLAGKFEVDAPSAASGRIVAAESNFPKGGYKIDKAGK